MSKAFWITNALIGVAYLPQAHQWWQNFLTVGLIYGSVYIAMRERRSPEPGEETKP